jgi:hypothetical protein
MSMASFNKPLVMKKTEKHKTGSIATTVSWRCKRLIKKSLGVVNGILRQNTAAVILRII